MSDLTFIERNQLEKLLGMGGGYVLDFTNRTFQEFIADAVGKSIDDPKYNYGSCSKANRLRQFWKIESNHAVGALTQQMVEYAATITDVEQSLIPVGRKIAARLLSSAPVPELDAIAPISDDRTFDALAKSARESIENNEPENGLDRLHTFVVKYVRTLCQAHGIVVERDAPLHGIFGAYLRRLRSEGRLQSEMTERILKMCISTLEAFNHVRNNHSFAHDNQILNYDESLLIFNHICALIRFLQSVEQRPTEAVQEAPASPPTFVDEIPF